MTTFPINVRELDGTISSVRPKSAAGEAYDDIQQALQANQADLAKLMGDE